MSDETRNQRDERLWLAGSRSAIMSTLRHCLGQLGVAGDPRFERERLLIERGEVVAQLRKLCDEFGDNDWEEGDSLGDVIEKNLGGHLYEDFVLDEDEHEIEDYDGFDEEPVEHDAEDGGELVDIATYHPRGATDITLGPHGGQPPVHEIERLDEIFEDDSPDES
jgi:hypothetical protein